VYCLIALTAEFHHNVLLSLDFGYNLTAPGMSICLREES
jgi:hypothetical protein